MRWNNRWKEPPRRDQSERSPLHQTDKLYNKIVIVDPWIGNKDNPDTKGAQPSAYGHSSHRRIRPWLLAEKPSLGLLCGFTPHRGPGQALGAQSQSLTATPNLPMARPCWKKLWASSIVPWNGETHPALISKSWTIESSFRLTANLYDEQKAVAPQRVPDWLRGNNC